MYQLASGQEVNFEKSCVSFSSADCLGIKRVDFHDKYLVLPVLVRKSKKETFAYVKDRVWKKLQSWRGGLLSSAGREILVNTVAQVLPTYSMQCFLLPKTFCEELNMLIAKFWWSGDPGKRKIHWLNWRTLCKPNMREDLVSVIFMLLTKRCWLSKLGVFFTILRRSCIGCSRPVISLPQIFWMLGCILIVHMFGEVLRLLVR